VHILEIIYAILLIIIDQSLSSLFNFSYSELTSSFSPSKYEVSSLSFPSLYSPSILS
jgi:hypothetical protein